MDPVQLRDSAQDAKTVVGDCTLGLTEILTCAAAFEMEYMIVPFSPTLGTLIPAVDETMTILDGSAAVLAEDRSGKKLSIVSSHRLAAGIRDEGY